MKHFVSPVGALLALALWGASAGAAFAQQDTANSGAGFWLQERARIIRVRPTPHMRAPTHVRRLAPNRPLARPTIWRRPTEGGMSAPVAEPLSEPPDFPAAQFPSELPVGPAAPQSADAHPAPQAAPPLLPQASP